MSLRSTAKRWTYLVHRWLGIGGCLLMLLWFVSGMVMLFIGYPKLTPGERLAALPVLGDAHGLLGLSALPATVQAEPEGVALTTLRGEPAYVVRSGSRVGAWSAQTGQALLPVSAQRAEASAAQFAGGQAFVGAMRVDEDRWTHSRALDAHRPLYRVEVGGRSQGMCMCPRTRVKWCWTHHACSSAGTTWVHGCTGCTSYACSRSIRCGRGW